MLIFQINTHLLMCVQVIQGVHLQHRTQWGERENTMIYMYLIVVCKETLLEDGMMHMKITSSREEIAAKLVAVLLHYLHSNRGRGIPLLVDLCSYYLPL